MIEWEFIAPMIVTVILILTTGGVLVLRPIMKPLVRLMEAAIREKERAAAPELGRIREVLEAMDSRLSLLEERQHFYERLSESSDASAPLGPAKGTVRLPGDGGTRA